VSVGVTGVGGGTVAAGVSVGAGFSPAGGSDCGATISVGLAGAHPAASRKVIISRMETIFGKGDMVDSPQMMVQVSPIKISNKFKDFMKFRLLARQDDICCCS
jgi:hypothetical protein